MSVAHPVTYHVVVGQGYLSCVLSAINRQLVLNRLALFVAPVSECPDALYAAFPLKVCHSRPAPFFLTHSLS
jgi:hypothetical protein